MKYIPHLLASAATLALTLPIAADSYTFRTVVKTGDIVPDLGGTFIDFGWPRINASGQAAFSATRTADIGNMGLWLSTPGQPDTLEAIMLAGVQAPGVGPGVVFDQFILTSSSPELNDAGNVAFSAPLLGLPGDSPRGIFRYINGSLTKVAATGDAAQGIGGGVTFAKFSGSVGFNEGNLTAFSASLAGPGVTQNNDSTVYMQWFGGLNLIKRQGSPVPPEGLGWTWGANSSNNNPDLLALVQIANDGRLGFDSRVITAQGMQVSRWTGWPGALTHGTMGLNLSPTFHPFVNDQLPGVLSMSLTEDGFTFVHAIDVNGEEREGIWRRTGNTIETIAYEGGAGPLGTYEKIWPYSPLSAYDGSVAFPVTFDLQDAAADEALVLNRPGQGSQIIQREGDPAPGYWPGVNFAHGVYLDAMDDLGRVYFSSYVTGPGINFDNSFGQYRTNLNGEIELILRKGQMITLNDDIERQVADFQMHFKPSNLHSGSRPAVNNDGDAAIYVQFTDGTNAIIVAERANCFGDLTGDWSVGVPDLLELLASWGSCTNCAADLNCDGTVGVSDLLLLLAAWGGCI